MAFFLKIGGLHNSGMRLKSENCKFGARRENNCQRLNRERRFEAQKSNCNFSSRCKQMSNSNLDQNWSTVCTKRYLWALLEPLVPSQSPLLGWNNKDRPGMKVSICTLLVSRLCIDRSGHVIELKCRVLKFGGGSAIYSRK